MGNSFLRLPDYHVAIGTGELDLLLVAGLKEEEIAKMDIVSMSNEELHDSIKRKLLGIMVDNGSKQKVVPLNEVDSYITSGWEFVAALPNGKAILKVPF